MEKKILIYSKYSNERCDKFAIRTDIIRRDGVKIIQKIPMKPEAKEHIFSLYDKYCMLKKFYSDSIVKPNICRRNQNFVEFEFLEGKTLQEILNEYVEKEDYITIIEKIKEYVSGIQGKSKLNKFYITKEFLEVFGEIEIPFPLETMECSNIDLIFGNIIINDWWNIIDYEWTFNFPVPFHFILYRAINIFMMQSARTEELRKLNLMKIFGIKVEEIEIYNKMEENFQRYVSGNHFTLDKIAENLPCNCINVRRLAGERFHDRVQVFFDKGQGYSEENSIYVKCKRENNKYKFELTDIEDDIRTIRIDPIEKSCFISDTNITDQNNEKINYVTNGIQETEQIIYFKENDPQIIIPKLYKELKKIQIEFICNYFDKDVAEKMFEIYKRREKDFRQKKEELQRKEEELQQKKGELQQKKEELQQKQKELCEKGKVIDNLCHILKNSILGKYLIKKYDINFGKDGEKNENF